MYIFSFIGFLIFALGILALQALPKPKRQVVPAWVQKRRWRAVERQLK